MLVSDGQVSAAVGVHHAAEVETVTTRLVVLAAFGEPRRKTISATSGVRPGPGFTSGHLSATLGE